MTRPSAPAYTNGAAKHSADYPTCADGSYAHLWRPTTEIDEENRVIWRCARCPALQPMAKSFITRWKHVHDEKKKAEKAKESADA